MRKSCALVSAISGLAITSIASAGVVDATIHLAEGDPLDGSTIDILNSPFTNSLGQIGLVAGLADGRRAVMLDGVAIFTSDDALPDSLTGGEGTMGIGDNGEFIYSPSFNGDDAVYGEIGLIARDNDPAIDFTAGFNNTFHSRPRMLPDGSSYWVSGTNDGMGGTSTQNRIVYLRNAGSGNIFGILRAGDNLGGAIVAPAGGIDFDNAISDDGQQFLWIFNDVLAGSTAADGTLAINNTVIAREGGPSGGGDNWDNFDQTSINNAGDSIFSGDTDGATTVDEFIAYNGQIVLRENDSVGGGILDGSVDAVSISNDGTAAFIWELALGGGLNETLFYASDASDIPGTVVRVVSVGDSLDTDGDGLGDLTVTDFNAGIGPGIDLAGDGLIHVELDVENNDLVEFEVIATFDVGGAGPCTVADNSAPFGVLDLADVQGFVNGFLNQTADADLAAPFSVWDFADVQAFVAAFTGGCP